MMQTITNVKLFNINNRQLNSHCKNSILYYWLWKWWGNLSDLTSTKSTSCWVVQHRTKQTTRWLFNIIVCLHLFAPIWLLSLTARGTINSVMLQFHYHELHTFW